jgi:hypothetical protein
LRFESEYGPLHEIGWPHPPPCSVADVEYFNLLPFLEDAIYYAINMRLVAVKQVPQFIPKLRELRLWTARCGHHVASCILK